MHVDAGQDKGEDVSSDSDSISSGEEEAVGAVNIEVLTTPNAASCFLLKDSFVVQACHSQSCCAVMGSVEYELLFFSRTDVLSIVTSCDVVVELLCCL